MPKLALTNLVNKAAKNIIIISLLYLTSACFRGKVDPFDPQSGITRAETEKALFGDYKNKKDYPKGSTIPQLNTIPKISKIITLPARPKKIEQQLISFSISDSVDLKDVLIELAKAAKLDLDLDPKIKGGVIINAKNRPLAEVLDRICEMGDLRYILENNTLKVENDTPFYKDYSLNSVKDGDLWSEVETNIKFLSGGTTSSNKLSNTITVFTSKKNHQKVEDYLNRIKKNSAAQVLIEAKVIEVALNNEFKTGINWNWVNGKGQVKSSGGYDASAPLNIITTPGSILGGIFSGFNISALEEFGAIKAISSPRINALNNQQAKLNFTKKLVYIVTNVTSNTVTTNGVSSQELSFTSTLNKEDTGTELTITPSIDLVNNEITLDIKPKITIKSGDVEQPYYYKNNDGGYEKGSNQIPVINTRELNTVAKIKSGNVLIIGGVMSEDSTNTDSGVPFLSKIPLLGYLFKSVSKSSNVNETVIFIKATIIRPNEEVNNFDKNINDKFSSSGRKIFNPN